MIFNRVLLLEKNFLINKWIQNKLFVMVVDISPTLVINRIRKEHPKTQKMVEGKKGKRSIRGHRSGGK